MLNILSLSEFFVIFFLLPAIGIGLMIIWHYIVKPLPQNIKEVIKESRKESDAKWNRWMEEMQRLKREE